MSPKTSTARRRRTTSVRRPKADDGPNVKRLSRARLLTSSSDGILGAAGMEKIERLTGPQVQTLINVARKVGRKPRCWLI